MILRIRTQDNLFELLYSGKIEVVGSVNRESLEKITYVGIYDTESSLCLQAEFDPANSQCIKNNNEQERLVVAFTNPRIVSTKYEWKDNNSKVYLEDTTPIPKNKESQKKEQKNPFKIRAYCVSEKEFTRVVREVYESYEYTLSQYKNSEGEPLDFDYRRFRGNNWNFFSVTQDRYLACDITRAILSYFEESGWVSARNVILDNNVSAIIEETCLILLSPLNDETAKSLGVKPKGKRPWYIVYLSPEGYSLSKVTGCNEEGSITFITKEDWKAEKIGLMFCQLSNPMKTTMVLPHIYTNYEYLGDESFVSSYNEGGFLLRSLSDWHSDFQLLALEYKGKWGCIDNRTRLLLPFMYDEIFLMDWFQINNAIIIKVGLNGKQGYVLSEKNVPVVEIVYEKLEANKVELYSNKFGFIP
ncbi:MAG: hypothetical protein NZM44_07110, partial [Candidatus Calescibacterium sp.]|nr:hypothetical protein [Candidatus Calescibacterium sp.]